MEEVDNMQKAMDNVSREMETLRINQKEILEIKNTATEMKNAFDGIISKLDTDEKTISALEVSKETSQTKMQRGRGEVIALW